MVLTRKCGIILIVFLSAFCFLFGCNKKNDNITKEKEYEQILQNDEFAGYSYIYIDINSDKKDELIIMTGTAHSSGGKIYAYCDNQVIEIFADNESEFGGYGSFYYDKRGYVIEYYDNCDGQNVNNYTFIYDFDGKKLALVYELETICNMDTLEYKYLLDGKVVTEEEYKKILESFDIICINIYDCKKIEDL